MINLKYFFLTILICISVETFAQTPKSMMIKFTKLYEKEGVAKAIDYIYGDNPWLKDAKLEIEKLKLKFEKLPNTLGNYHGSEFLYGKQVGKCLYFAAYLFKFDRQPIRIKFQFYKPNKHWRIHKFTFDDSFDEDVEEIIKYGLLELIKD